ncbi:hypothetical protein LOAG_18813 [Loa loa]|uniref:Uncharacterized protein n=1 Tax=Loa loa TaxID=7209 RepID=A0A1S0UDX2_LOALO|nr:hypothetical protein LOAG_18813 [Loa loa]EJD73789.1 hypothetical protein LOAG_18813 [Loa loa]
MAKLVEIFVFVICCGAMMPPGVVPGAVPGVMAIVMHGAADKLWDNDQLIETMQLKLTLTNCGTMKDARLPDLEENLRLFVRNTLELIK